MLLLAGTGMSQNSPTTLNQKWDNMLSKSENYQNYKVIKTSELLDVWKSIQDSIVRFKAELVQERNRIKGQNAQIIQLQKQVSDVKEELNGVTTQKNSMSFLGMDVDKYVYTSALWMIILIVVGSCAVLFYLYTKSNKVTVQKITEYDQLSRSFEEYKQGKIEMERKLKREIQTNANMVEELKSKLR
jgi:F0F1-type ATP synthase assembly protein I